MSKINFDTLLDAGVHFGHLKRKWNPNMAPYIHMEKGGIHIIDLHKTSVLLETAAAAAKQVAKSGKKILFVATKKQAKDIVADRVSKTGMPYATNRWPGGMLTNFATIRKAVKKMSAIDKLMKEPAYDNLSKRERLQLARERAKLESNFGSISDLTRLPSALFIVDVVKENIAVSEARKLNIPIFAMVDTNSNPKDIDFVIPSNDDATRSISLIVDVMCTAIEEGVAERKLEREKRASEQAEADRQKQAKAEATKLAKEEAAKAKTEAKSEEA